MLKLEPFAQIGTPMELVRRFGGRDKYLEALRKLDSALYESA